MRKKLRMIKIEWIILFMMMMFLISVGIYRNQFRRIVDDEIFSMGLANTTEDFIFMYNDRIIQYQNEDGWFSGSHFKDYLTVQADERFSVKNVFQNQARDNHPPFFYLLVNMISSFSPNQMNYLGIVMINIIVLCFMITILYLCMRKMVGDSFVTMLPSFCFLLSSGCMQMTDYIRMYTILCFFTLCLIYIHICFLVEQKITRSRLIAISMTVCLGGLTHYYFYVFGFFVAFFYFVLQVILWKQELSNRIKELIQYILSYVIGGMGALVCFPAVISQVLKSDMSDKMSNQIKGDGLPIGEALEVIQQSVLDGKGHWFVLMVIAIGICMLYFILNSKYQKESVRGISINRYCYIAVWLLLVCIGYCFLVVKASIYVAWFYLSPVFCPIFLLISLICICPWQYANKKVTIIFVLALCVLSSISFIEKIPTMNQTRKNNQAYVNMIKTFEGDDCFYISDNWTCLYGNHLPNMSVMDEVRCITPDEWKSSQLNQILAGRETDDREVILIFRKVNEQEMLIEQLKQQTTSTVEKVWQDEKNAFYRVQLGL